MHGGWKVRPRTITCHYSLSIPSSALTEKDGQTCRSSNHYSTKTTQNPGSPQPFLHVGMTSEGASEVTLEGMLRDSWRAPALRLCAFASHQGHFPGTFVQIWCC